MTQHCKNMTDAITRYNNKYDLLYTIINYEMNDDSDYNRIIHKEPNVHGLIEQSNYLHQKYYNRAPIYVIMNAVYLYANYKRLLSEKDRNEIIEIIRTIRNSTVERYVRNEFKRKFEEANKKSWFKNWLE